MDLVDDLLPPTTPDEWETGILRAQTTFHALGITAWQDAKIADPQALAAYRAVAARGELTMRVEGNLLWDRDRGEEQLDDLLALREQGSLGRLRIRGAKIFADGVLENFTGALLEPYVGTDNYGISMLDRRTSWRAVVVLDAQGFQVHMHTIGDRAVRDALDAIEAARAQRPPGRAPPPRPPPAGPPGRPATVRRARRRRQRLPLWACHSGYVDELTVPFIGPERSARMYPFGSLLRAGARLAFGSDWPVSTSDPLPAARGGRDADLPRDTRPGAAAPGGRARPADGAETFTAGSAYVNFLESETGTVELAKLADLVVLDRDVLDPGAGPIGDARVT